MLEKGHIFLLVFALAVVMALGSLAEDIKSVAEERIEAQERSESVIITPNAGAIYDYIKAEYGLPIGVTNCRRISGSQTWSQHSWSNAIDIHTSNKALQDSIKADLESEFGEHIRNILTWRFNSAHRNHIHVDMWPKGYLTPPCAGGALRIKYKDGSITRGEPFPLTIKEDDMAILTDKEQIELQEFLAHIKAVNSNVGFVRQSIGDIRERNTRGLPAQEDHDHSLTEHKDLVARNSAAHAHLRLDKLKEI